MNKRRINIAILEPSQIVYEGLSNILSKSGGYLKLIRVDSLQELDTIIAIEKPDALIVNPTQIQNKTREFTAIKKNNTDKYWIGLVYTFIDQQLLSLFDRVINITDSADSINALISNLLDSNSLHISDNEHEQLSEREKEVLKLLVTGFSNREIAEKLFISIHTVVSHRKNLSKKTGIKSQSGLTIFALSNGIIQIEDYQN